jgi:HK97 family phage prohead protease
MTVVVETKVPDFTGYATRFDRECTDGRTIKHSAFMHQDKQQVQLVWQHQHDNPENVLGHAILHQREDGIYTEAFFNNTDRGQHAKQLVIHGDIKALSIYANKLQQKGSDVVHGNIIEVSLVYKGANPDAYIEDVNLRHSGDGTDTMVGEAIIYPGEEFELYHADDVTHAAAPAAAPTSSDATAPGETVQDVVNSMTPKQRKVLYALVKEATDKGNVKHIDEADGDVIIHDGDEEIDVKEVMDSYTPAQREIVDALVLEASTSEETSEEGSGKDSTEDASKNADGVSDAAADDANKDADNPDGKKGDDADAAADSTDPEKLQHSTEGSKTMKYNVFEQGANGASTPEDQRHTLNHGDILEINELFKETGHFKKAYEKFSLNHADYGITNLDILFPDARATSSQPELIARQTEWVEKVLSATKHSPFAKVKTILADLTAEEARAKGYVKGSLKKDEVVPLLQRSTSPATVYKKQKLDRDDVIDITDIDIISWLKWEIRFMLNEEIARAILIGDGRTVGTPDKIKDPQGQTEGTGIRSIANDDDLYAHKVQLAANVAPGVMIDEITRSRTNYRGSGSPTLYTTDAVITEMLLLKDKMGRRLYETEASLAAAIRVKEIVPVEPMGEDATLIGVIVNLIDYTVGSTKGGEITSFEDFDIDYNQYKYLMETRLSGALTKPKSALVIRRDAGTEVTAQAPSFNTATNTLTIPTVTGVDYVIDGSVVPAGDRVITESTDVYAEPETGYYLAPLSTRSWTFSYTAP